MFCFQCGQRLPGEARFCPACGTRVADISTDAEAASPPPAVTDEAEPVYTAFEPDDAAAEMAAEPVASAVPESAPTTTVRAQSAWQRGASERGASDRIASPRMGTLPPAPPLPPIPPSPPVYSPPSNQAGAAFTAARNLPPAQLAALGGFLVAILGTFLAWLRISEGRRGEAINGWSGESQYRFADWFVIDAPLDALMVLVIGGLGVYLILGRLLGSNVPAIPWGITAAGLAIAVIGALNWLYIDSEANRINNRDLDIGIGIYLLIIGGIVAAVGGWRDLQQAEYESQPT